MDGLSLEMPSFSLSSLEIHAWHLKFQDSPSGWVYLCISTHSFNLLIFILDPFVSFFFKIASFNLVFLFF